MIETDIQLYGAGTNFENSSLPVMAHDPPALNYELTFEEWMQEVTTINRIFFNTQFNILSNVKWSLYIFYKF